jgi:membrane protease YdiL (CAAX protease family)
MYLLGGMQIRGLETTGSTLVLSALAWLGSNVCVGVAEEFFSRSYLLQTLKRASASGQVHLSLQAGGLLGTEASFLMYPAIALTWVYIWWRYRPPAEP